MKKDTGSIKERHFIPWNTERGYLLSKLKAFTIQVVSTHNDNTAAICYLPCTRSKMVPTIYTVPDINLVIPTIYTAASLKLWCYYSDFNYSNSSDFLGTYLLLQNRREGT
jgi:hypothetical protein